MTKENQDTSPDTVVITILEAWAGGAEMQYSGKFRYRNGQHFSGIFKVSSIAQWKGR